VLLAKVTKNGVRGRERPRFLVAIDEDRMDRNHGSAHDRLAWNGFTRQIRQSRGLAAMKGGSLARSGTSSRVLEQPKATLRRVCDKPGV